MERKTLYQDDLNHEDTSTPVDREENEHSLALDPDAAADDEADEADEDEEDEEDEDLDD